MAALVAMKPSLEQSTLIAERRLAGAVVGAVLAALFLLSVDNKVALGVIVALLCGPAGALRGVNYAWYCAAVAGGVLIAEGIPHPSDLSEEARRVAFTFAGVGIAVLVTFLAGLLSKHAGQAARPQTAGRKQGDRQPVTDWPSCAGGMRRDGA